MKSIYEVCETVTDYVAAGSFADLKKNVEYLSEPNYAQLIRTVDLKSRFLKGNFIYVSKKAFDYLWRVNLNCESIILPNIGNCGEVYYVVPEKLPYKNNVLATNAILVRSLKESNKYLFYIFQSKHFQDELKRITSPVGQTKFNKTELKNICIPIPSRKVQEEIVKILDSFTNLIDALNEELSLRQKQFEYYREKLLSNKYWIKLRISDVCEVINGRAYSQKELMQKGKYRVLRVGNFFSNDSWYYSDLELDDKYYCNNGDLLYAWSATFGPQMWNNGKAIFHYHIWKLDCNNLIRKKYFFYWLSSDYMKEQIKNNTHGATMTHLTKNVMENIIIEVPSLSIQQSIVSKLDAFESLISSLKEEIALRQKQYEYYREKLLTFD